MFHDDQLRDNPGPHNFDQLLASARHQIDMTVLTLQERAEHLQKFLNEFESTGGDPELIEDLAHTYWCHLHDDHLVPAIVEIIHNWPQVAGAPGEGYW